jgi:hypothetical protein
MAIGRRRAFPAAGAGAGMLHRGAVGLPIGPRVAAA